LPAEIVYGSEIDPVSRKGGPIADASKVAQFAA